MDKKTQTDNKALVGPGLFFGIIVSVVLYVFLGVNGGFAGNVDKDYFTNVSSWYSTERFTFWDVGDIGNRIWMDNPEQIEVRVDSSLEGTAISATPKVLDRVFGSGYVYKAHTVVVWVQNEEEKAIWEKYIQSVIDKWDTNTQPKTIIP